MSEESTPGVGWPVGLLLVGTAVGIVAIILFWTLVGTRLTLSPWIAVVLPSALAGASAAWGVRKWSFGLLAMILALAALSSAFGEWASVHGKLQAAASQPKGDAADMARAMEAIARAEMTEGIKPPEGAPLVAPMRDGGASLDAASSATIAWERTKREPWAALASLALSIFAALQAAHLVMLAR